MSEEIKSIDTEKHGGITTTELLFSHATYGAAVVAGAMYDPKLPPLASD